MKITVAEFKAFDDYLNASWDENWSTSNQLETGADEYSGPDDVEFVSTMADTDIVNFIGSDVDYHDVHGKSPPFNHTMAWFKKWRREQTHVRVLIDIPKDQIEKISTDLAALGCKIIKA